MDVVAHPYIYYLAQVISNMRCIIGFCSLCSFLGFYGLLLSKKDINKVMEYNEVFKNEEINVNEMIKENNTKLNQAFKCLIIFIILIIIALLIPSSKTAYYILLNL